MSLYIPIILGTAREGRLSEKVAQQVYNFAKGLDIETEIIDVRNFAKGSTQEKNSQSQLWQTKASKADGFVVVTPEYNHGYPGELKILLDDLTKEYNYKPIGYVGVSSGALGGARAVEQLRLVAITLKMTPISTAVYFSNVSERFDEQGNLKEAEIWTKRFSVLFEELLQSAKLLKSSR